MVPFLPRKQSNGKSFLSSVVCTVLKVVHRTDLKLTSDNLCFVRVLMAFLSDTL